MATKVRSSKLRRWRLAVVGSTVGALVFTSVALAHFDKTAQYSHSACPANSSNRLDPIGIVFFNQGYLSTTTAAIENHARWYDQGGSNQYYVDHNNCRNLEAQRASNGVRHSRYHVRLWQQRDADTRWGTSTVGTPHHEYVRWCGAHHWRTAGFDHVVEEAKNGKPSGFDRGRRELARHFVVARMENWGNTRRIKQCNGERAGSNGYVVWISLPQ